MLTCYLEFMASNTLLIMTCFWYLQITNLLIVNGIAIVFICMNQAMTYDYARIENIHLCAVRIFITDFRKRLLNFLGFNIFCNGCFMQNILFYCIASYLYKIFTARENLFHKLSAFKCESCIIVKYFLFIMTQDRTFHIEIE